MRTLVYTGHLFFQELKTFHQVVHSLTDFVGDIFFFGRVFVLSEQALIERMTSTRCRRGTTIFNHFHGLSSAAAARNHLSPRTCPQTRLLSSITVSGEDIKRGYRCYEKFGGRTFLISVYLL